MSNQSLQKSQDGLHWLSILITLFIVYALIMSVALLGVLGWMGELSDLSFKSWLILIAWIYLGSSSAAALFTLVIMNDELKELTHAALKF